MKSHALSICKQRTNFTHHVTYQNETTAKLTAGSELQFVCMWKNLVN